MKTLTETDLLAGAAYAVAHPEEYDQSNWCGTACCVLGHARRLAGSDVIDSGPLPDEINISTPRARMLANMLLWTHSDTAVLMPHVHDDGTLVVPAGGIGSFGSGVVVHKDAQIYGADTQIAAGAIIGEGARVWPGAIIGYGARVWPGASIGAGAKIGAGAEIAADAQIYTGAEIGADAVIGAGTVVEKRVVIGPRVMIPRRKYVGEHQFA